MTSKKCQITSQYPAYYPLVTNNVQNSTGDSAYTAKTMTVMLVQR